MRIIPQSMLCSYERITFLWMLQKITKSLVLKILIYMIFIYCICIQFIGLFGLEYTAAIAHTINVTDVMESTCEVDFATLYIQPTVTNQPSISTINNQSMRPSTVNVGTSSLSMNAIFTAAIESDTFSGTADTSTLVILLASVAGGMLGLCTIFVCIVGLIVINKKRKEKVRKDIFSSQSLTAVFDR